MSQETETPAASIPATKHAEDLELVQSALNGDEESVRDTHIHNTRANQYAIRHGDWLLIDAKDGYVSPRNKVWEANRNYPPDDKQPVELFNLKEDIGQKVNLADKHPDKVSELKSLLSKIREQGHSAPRLAK